MAAPTDQPGAFALEVARIGKEVTASLTDFITSRKVQERRMDSILATISITTSRLTELGNMMNQHVNSVYIADDVIRPTCETCKTDLEKLLLMSKEICENSVWTLGGKTVTAEVDPWFLFSVALGNPKDNADFWTRIEATRYSLIALTETVKYKIYKELKQRNGLTPEQDEEFKKLTAFLPQLVKTIERAEQIKKSRLEFDAKVARKAKELEEHKLAVEAEKALKSSRNRPDVGQKDDPEKPILERKESIAASELTMVDREPRRERIIIDDDSSSIRSFNSMDDSNFLDTKEFLEEWRMRWNEPLEATQRSWGLLGLKIKQRWEEAGFWGIDPELRSEAELRSAYEALTYNVSEAQHRANVNKAIRKLPLLAQDSIQRLIEDRQNVSSNTKFRRQWSVVAIRSTNKRYFGGEGFFNSVKSQDWIIMIKGETIDTAERKMPNRWDDPWRKPYHREPIRYRGRERNYHSHRARDWSPSRSPPPRRRAPIVNFHEPARSHTPPPLLTIPVHGEGRRRLPMTNMDPHGYRPGTIVVGAVSPPGEAERKMDEILEDLPAKFAV